MPRLGDDATLREHFAWTYGRLAMAHKAVVDGDDRYNRLHYWISRNFREKYLAGTMKMRPLHEDERTKIRCCIHLLLAADPMSRIRRPAECWIGRTWGPRYRQIQLLLTARHDGG